MKRTINHCIRWNKCKFMTCIYVCLSLLIFYKSFFIFYSFCLKCMKKLLYLISMLLGQNFLIYLLYFCYIIILCMASCNLILFIYQSFSYLLNDVLLMFKHFKYFSPIFISRYLSYIFELFVNFDVAILLNIINNYIFFRM